MRILFVFPNINDAGYKLVGVSTLSALAKKAGHETALFDTSFIDTSSISKVKHFKSNNAIGEEINVLYVKGSGWDYDISILFLIIKFMINIR